MIFMTLFLQGVRRKNVCFLLFGSERKKFTSSIIFEGSFKILRCGYFEFGSKKLELSNFFQKIKLSILKVRNWHFLSADFRVLVRDMKATFRVISHWIL
jgi:hypothetical protein